MTKYGPEPDVTVSHESEDSAGEQSQDSSARDSGTESTTDPEPESSKTTTPEPEPVPETKPETEPESGLSSESESDPELDTESPSNKSWSGRKIQADRETDTEPKSGGGLTDGGDDTSQSENRTNSGGGGGGGLFTDDGKLSTNELYAFIVLGFLCVTVFISTLVVMYFHGLHHLPNAFWVVFYGSLGVLGVVVLGGTARLVALMNAIGQTRGSSDNSGGHDGKQ